MPLVVDRPVDETAYKPVLCERQRGKGGLLEFRKAPVSAFQEPLSRDISVKSGEPHQNGDNPTIDEHERAAAFFACGHPDGLKLHPGSQHRSNHQMQVFWLKVPDDGEALSIQ